jgi:rSAM/selenodomain-associated transferase 1
VCAEYTFAEVLETEKDGVTAFLFCSEEYEIEQIKNWTGNKFKYYSQQGNELGSRMINAFNIVFKTGFKKVIIIGTDAPGINSRLILDAFEALNNHECVIGPSPDGGYYLLGLDGMQNSLFKNIKWSTNSVFNDTIKQLKHIKSDFLILQKLRDIDILQDLIDWSRNFSGIPDHPVKLFIESNPFPSK